MDDELTFRRVFAAGFLSMAVIRLYYHYKAGTFRERFHTEAEGKLLAALRGLSIIPLSIASFTYMIFPQWMMWSALPLPIWSRWIGAGLGAFTVPLLFWVNYTLGKNFSTTLRIREDHTLVTYGPYGWVRHPMYTVFFLMMIAFFFLSANWFIGLWGISPIMLVMAVRTSDEEKQLIEKFGDEYLEYMKRTGRFLPRVIR